MARILQDVRMVFSIEKWTFPTISHACQISI